MNFKGKISVTSAPTLWVMCGPSGSGKSTAARSLTQYYINYVGKPIILISTDNIRKELFGDASIQSNGDRVFELAARRIHTALSNGISVIFDATNLRSNNRRWVLSQIPKNIKVVRCAIFMRTSLEECIARQKLRTRQVPESVISRQFSNYFFPSHKEGFDHIYTIKGDEINEF